MTFVLFSLRFVTLSFASNNTCRYYGMLIKLLSKLNYSQKVQRYIMMNSDLAVLGTINTSSNLWL